MRTERNNKEKLDNVINFLCETYNTLHRLNFKMLFKKRYLRFVRVYFTREPFNSERITYLNGECKLPPCVSTP